MVKLKNNLFDPPNRVSYALLDHIIHAEQVTWFLGSPIINNQISQCPFVAAVVWGISYLQWGVSIILGNCKENFVVTLPDLPSLSYQGVLVGGPETTESETPNQN